MNSDRRQRRFAETRQRIDEAGRALLGKSSESEVSLLMITERADISHATFYSHFESKDAFIAALRSDTNDAATSGVVGSFELDSEAPLAMARMVRAMFRQAIVDSEWASFALSTRADLAEFGGAIDVAILGNLTAGIEQGCYLEVRDRETTVLSVRSSVRAGLRFAIDRDIAATAWSGCVMHALSMLGVSFDQIEDVISVVASDLTSIAERAIEPR